jgi:esterase/lipase superfamily enzyme
VGILTLAGLRIWHASDRTCPGAWCSAWSAAGITRALRGAFRLAASGAFLFLGVLVLAACAQRGTIDIASDAEPVGSVETILVASARQPDPVGPGFGEQATSGLAFAEFRISVPPERAVGTVTFTPRNRAPDPKTDFLTVASERLGDEAAFLRSVNDRLATLPKDRRELFVFVHGFNTNFAEGLYRQAQMSHDFQSPGVSINFAWPSAGRVTAYATDREAVLVARDQLQTLLQLLARSQADRVVVLGHSMGTMVVMEAMRQIALTDDRAVLARTDAIALIAADLDVEVFRAQMRPLAEDKVDVFVFTSSRDAALRLSARLRGSSDRLGTLSDGARLSDLPVTLVDLSNYEGEEDALGHFKVATSPALISLFQGLGSVGLDILRDQPASVGLVEAGTGLVTGTVAALSEPLAPR